MSPTETAGRPRWVVLSHHKCGSTWTAEVLSGLCARAQLKMRRAVMPDTLPYEFHRIEPFRSNCLATLEDFANPGADLVFHGNAYSRLLAALDKTGTTFRGVHIIRDPRDILVSGYFSHLESHPADPNVNPWMVCLRAALRSAPTREAGLLLELDYVRSYFSRLAQFLDPDPRIRTVRFEDLVADPHSAFAEMLEGMEFFDDKVRGVRRHDLNAILEDLSFARLQKNNPGHYRKGKAGDWRQHFTPAVTQAFKEAHAELLVRLGYETDDRW